MSARYIIKRIINAVFVLFIVITLNFILPRLIFDDPAEPLLRGIPEEETALREAIRKEYGLSGSLMSQYVIYIGKALRFDFGVSYIYKQPVFEVMFSKIPWSMVLSLTAMIISLSAGIVLGAKAAKNRGKWQDKTLLAAATVTSALPSFWIAIVFLMLFAFSIPIFPYRGAMTEGYTLQFNTGLFALSLFICLGLTTAAYLIFKKTAVLFTAPFVGLILSAIIAVPISDTADIAMHAALPLIVICVGGIISYALMVRSSMIAVVGEDYILTARAKGLGENQVLLNHTLRNALLPMVTNIGMQLSGVFGGSVLIERIFSWPGMGGLLIEAQSIGDFQLAQAIMFFYSFITISANLMTDFIYHKLDPRIKTE